MRNLNVKTIVQNSDMVEFSYEGLYPTVETIRIAHTKYREEYTQDEMLVMGLFNNRKKFGQTKQMDKEHIIKFYKEVNGETKLVYTYTNETGWSCLFANPYLCI